MAEMLPLHPVIGKKTIHTLGLLACITRCRISVASLKPYQILSSEDAKCSDGLDLWPSPHVGCWAGAEPAHTLPRFQSAYPAS